MAYGWRAGSTALPSPQIHGLVDDELRSEAEAVLLPVPSLVDLLTDDLRAGGGGTRSIRIATAPRSLEEAKALAAANMG